MIIATMVQALMIAALLSAAAWLLERSFRALGLPTRGIWLAALVGSVFVPVAPWLTNGLINPSVYANAVSAGLLVTQAGALESFAEAGRQYNIPLAAAWLLTVGVGLALLVVAMLRLHRQQSAWAIERVEGCEVLVSEETGPAVTGLLKGRIVLPRWALAHQRCALMLAHEQQHLRAGDPRLLFLGVLTVVLAPWNLLLWWQLSRLQLAIEVDCDTRVLAERKGDVREYGSLLLEVSSRVDCPLALPAFSNPRTSLEERILAMTERPRGRRMRVVLPLIAGAALFLTGASFPDPNGILCRLSSMV